MVSQPLADLSAVFDRHGVEPATAWLMQHLEASALLVATGAVGRADVDDGQELLLERLVMHLVADTLSAPLFHHRWEGTGEPMAMEAYGATQGVIRLATELLDEFTDPVVLEHVQERLDHLVGVLASADTLPDGHVPL